MCPSMPGVHARRVPEEAHVRHNSFDAVSFLGSYLSGMHICQRRGGNRSRFDLVSAFIGKFENWCQFQPLLFPLLTYLGSC